MKAKIQIAAIEFICPFCQEFIPNEDGSHLWELHEIPNFLKCIMCGKISQSPTKALKLRNTYGSLPRSEKKTSGK